MSNLSLEISEREYVIKFDRNSYSLSAIERVLKQIKNDYNNIIHTDQDHDGDVRSHINDQYFDSYDHLSEK
jgi:hypothetical protein